MTRPFLDQRINENARNGSGFNEGFAVENTVTGGGYSYGHWLHPYPLVTYNLIYDNSTHQFAREELRNLFKKCGGTFTAFRVRHHLDYSSNGDVETPTATDQQCLWDGTNSAYQLIKWYGTQGDTTQARRRILKPVDGSGLVSIDNQAVTTDFSIDYTTGLITFTDNPHSITGITKASQAVVTVTGNDYQVGDWAYISGTDMTEINGARYEVVAQAPNTITLDVDSTTFTTYTTGGTVNTEPQTGETVRAGFYYDLPMRFERDLDVTIVNAIFISMEADLIEVLNL